MPARGRLNRVKGRFWFCGSGPKCGEPAGILPRGGQPCPPKQPLEGIEWGSSVDVRSLLLVACLSMFVIAACGGDDDSGSGGSTSASGVRRRADRSRSRRLRSRTYLDPALTYTVNGIEPLWLVYTPLITYKRAEGQAGAELIPGLAEDLPEISADGKTYKLTLRKGYKYSDGTPVKASDFEHAIKRVAQPRVGRSAFYLGIEGAQDYLDAGKADGDISGITTDDKTGDITIKLTAPDGSFTNVLAMWFAGPVPGDTPFKNLTKDPPPGVGPYMVTESVPNRQFVLEKNAELRQEPDPGCPAGQHRQDHDQDHQDRPSARRRT